MCNIKNIFKIRTIICKKITEHKCIEDLQMHIDRKHNLLPLSFFFKSIKRKMTESDKMRKEGKRFPDMHVYLITNIETRTCPSHTLPWPVNRSGKFRSLKNASSPKQISGFVPVWVTAMFLIELPPEKMFSCVRLQTQQCKFNFLDFVYKAYNLDLY